MKTIDNCNLCYDKRVYYKKFKGTHQEFIVGMNHFKEIGCIALKGRVGGNGQVLTTGPDYYELKPDFDKFVGRT